MARLALTRLRHQWGLSLIQAVGLAAAVALAVAVPLLQAEAAQAGLRLTLDRLGSTRYLTIEQFNVRDAVTYDRFQSETRHRVQAELGGHVEPASHYAGSNTLRPTHLNGAQLNSDPGDPLPTLSYFEEVEHHSDLVAGAWPQDTQTPAALPASIPEPGAALFGLKLGDVYCMSASAVGRAPVPRLSEVCTSISAIWRPRDPAGSYWAGAPPIFSIFLQRAGFFQMAQQQPVSLRAGQVENPLVDTMTMQNARAVADRVNALRGYYEIQRQGLMATRLDRGIRDFLHRSEVAQFATQLVATVLLGIALYAVAFVAGHALFAQRQVLAVLSCRGWSRWRLWRLSMLQFAMLALLAVPAGVALAVLTVWLLGRGALSGELDPLGPAELVAILPALAVTLGAALGIMGVLTAIAGQRGLLDVRRGQSRATALPWARRRHLDLVLALLAIPLLAESRLRGSGAARDISSAAAGDPFGLVLPGLALSFLGIASLRLLPLCSSAIRLVGRGLAGRLAEWQLNRQPGQHARLALLLSIAVAVGLFSSVYYSTERRSQLDRVAYATGADLRAHYQFTQEAPDLDRALAGLQGVSAASRAYRVSAVPGRSTIDAVVLGIDPGTFAGAAWWRAGLESQPLDALLAGLNRTDPEGLTLPGRPAALSLWVFSSGLGAELIADVIDADGRHCTCAFGPLTRAGWRQLQAQVRFPTRPHFPLTLRGLEVGHPGGGPADGNLALSDLSAVQPDGAATVVEAFAASTGWWRESRGTVIGVTELNASSRFQREARDTTGFDVHTVQGALLLRPRPPDKPVPALVSSQLLGALGLKPGDTLPVAFENRSVDVRVIRAVDQFPTLYQQQLPFLVLNMDTLLDRLGRSEQASAWPNELWLRLKAPPSAQMRLHLRQDRNLNELVDRESAQAAAVRDPIRLALDTTLVMGFVAALVMSVIGFALHFLVVARTRLSDYAILQANGLSRPAVLASLAAEQAVLLLYSLLVGAALGALLAWVILPSLELGVSITDVTPPAVLTVDPPSALAATLAVALCAGLVGWLVGRAGARFSLMDELRALA